MINLNQLNTDTVWLCKEHRFAKVNGYKEGNLSFPEIRVLSGVVNAQTWQVKPDGTGFDGKQLVIPIYSAAKPVPVVVVEPKKDVYKPADAEKSWKLYASSFFIEYSGEKKADFIEAVWTHQYPIYWVERDEVEQYINDQILGSKLIIKDGIVTVNSKPLPSRSKNLDQEMRFQVDGGCDRGILVRRLQLSKILDGFSASQIDKIIDDYLNQELLSSYHNFLNIINPEKWEKLNV
jgi:hypothetical protein